MRVLFVAETYLNLYLPIYEELVRQGHSLYFIKGDTLSFDYFSVKMNPVNRLIKHLYNILFNPYKRYWKKIINTTKDLSIPFDVYIDIQGVTYHPFLSKHLKKINPQIKSVLYIWDSSKIYDYFRNAPYFDKVYTFDYYDSKTHSNVQFMPFYWTPFTAVEEDVDISIVGTDHDDRLKIVEVIGNQAKRKNLTIDFRILIKVPPISNNFFIKNWRRLSPKWKRAYDEYECNRKSEYAIFNKMSVGEVQHLMARSKCILDTDMECQTGVTPRLLWAIAAGKKIITTNQYITALPFFNSRQFSIIDRKNPLLDINFVNKKESFPISDYLLNLRIDNWINKLL